MWQCASTIIPASITRHRHNLPSPPPGVLAARVFVFGAAGRTGSGAR